MAHYAKVNAITKKVLTVIKAEQDFIDNLPDSGFWVQTSYNTHHGKYYTPQPQPETEGQGYRDADLATDQSKALRWNYAVIGGTYDVDRDAFLYPKPYPSWVLDETIMDWKSPVPYPQNAQVSYVWDEETRNWVDID